MQYISWYSETKQGTQQTNSERARERERERVVYVIHTKYLSPLSFFIVTKITHLLYCPPYSLSVYTTESERISLNQNVVTFVQQF